MRIVFMGTPDFSVAPLKALIEAGHQIVAVYSQPPRPAGRGQAERKSSVHLFAEAENIEVRTPKSLRSPEEQARFSQLNPDVAVVVAYGLILPKAILEAPKLGCLNIHASLLPRWRGAAPIHRAIMAGDQETGISIMQMDEGLDTGPVLKTERIAINSGETTASLHDRLSVLGARLIVDVLDQLEHLPPQPQPETGVTYASKIDKSEARINFTDDAVSIDRTIRALSPFPGAWALSGDERIKLLDCTLGQGSGTPGTHLGNFEIACGNGSVRIKSAQREGKRAMNADEFLRGKPISTRLT
jgi:methionyl-tRNA formyltransferase